ncbi:hypothetical protein D3C80_1951810 [compost metagenome]
MRFYAGNFLMVPEIPARRPTGLATSTADNQHLVDDDILLGGDIDRGVCVFFQRNRFAAAYALIAGDHKGGFTVHDSASKGFR